MFIANIEEPLSGVLTRYPCLTRKFGVKLISDWLGELTPNLSGTADKSADRLPSIVQSE